MSIIAEKTVRELALEKPAAPRVFERLGIDYCCGGNRTLEEACRSANLAMSDVLDSLEKADRTITAARDWRTRLLSELTVYIQGTHHQYTRDEIARLGPLLDKVCSVHGATHPELLHIRATFAGLAQELSSHMLKEEMVLFPYITGIEEARLQNRTAATPPFGTVNNPVTMMLHEHEVAGVALREIRRASDGYAPPPGACVNYQTLYKALAEFEADLHQHIHLENNVLFPRAIELEKTPHAERSTH